MRCSNSVIPKLTFLAEIVTIKTKNAFQFVTMRRFKGPTRECVASTMEQSLTVTKKVDLTLTSFRLISKTGTFFLKSRTFDRTLLVAPGFSGSGTSIAISGNYNTGLSLLNVGSKSEARVLQIKSQSFPY